VANSLFESPDEGFTAVEAHLVACATPQEDIPDCLFGRLEKLLAFAISNIFFPNSKGSQRLCCLQAAGHHELIAAF
jgi:hypothetical protein